MIKKILIHTSSNNKLRVKFSNIFHSKEEVIKSVILEIFHHRQRPIRSIAKTNKIHQLLQSQTFIELAQRIIKKMKTEKIILISTKLKMQMIRKIN
jgi:hypothetical protein